MRQWQPVTIEIEIAEVVRVLQPSVCIDMVFTELPFLERIDAVARAGVPAFEFWGWPERDVDAIAERQRRHGLSVACFSVSPHTWLVEDGTTEAFLKAVRESSRVAHKLGCRVLNTLVDNPANQRELLRESRYGDAVPDARRATQQANVIANLRAAASIAEGEGVILAVEPLNSLVDHAGYYLEHAPQAFEIITAVDSPAVKLLFDIYHQQISDGNVTANLTANIDLVGHIHAADNPGRHQPGTGEINYLNVLRAISRAGYSGYVGLEYEPSGDPTESLRHIREVIDTVNREG